MDTSALLFSAACEGPELNRFVLGFQALVAGIRCSPALWSGHPLPICRTWRGAWHCVHGGRGRGCKGQRQRGAVLDMALLLLGS